MGHSDPAREEGLKRALVLPNRGAGFVDLQWATYLGLPYLGFHSETASKIAWGAHGNGKKIWWIRRTLTTVLAHETLKV